jgi:perosamine synthetase
MARQAPASRVQPSGGPPPAALEVSALLLDGVVGVRFQRVPDAMRPSYTYVAVDLGDRRDDVAAALESAGIQTKSYFRPLHSMPLFAKLPRARLATTERLSASLLCLPLYADLSEDEVKEVADRVRAAIAP